MHKSTSIQKIFAKSLRNIHQARAASLFDAGGSLLNGADLTVTSLGRFMPGTALEKSKIHRADAIVGNGQLNADRIEIAHSFVNYYFGKRETLFVLIDDSGCCSNERFIVQASIANNGLGRSQPIHSRIYGKGRTVKTKAHNKFLQELKIIFSDVKKDIVIVTDAGFHAPWFKQIVAYGWDYVGRVRGNVKVRFKRKEDWETVNDIYMNATGRVKSIGEGTLGKDDRNNINGHFYLVKKKYLGRKKNKSKYPDHERRCKKLAKDPWLLVSSIKNGPGVAVEIKNIYDLRMQIEQNFRDIKNGHFGFGLEYSGTKDIMRLENLLLIAIVAAFMAMIIGWCGEKIKLHWEIQANTVRHRRVLSLVFLGIRIWKTRLSDISAILLRETIREYACLCAMES